MDMETDRKEFAQVLPILSFKSFFMLIYSSKTTNKPHPPACDLFAVFVRRRDLSRIESTRINGTPIKFSVILHASLVRNPQIARLGAGIQTTKSSKRENLDGAREEAGSLRLSRSNVGVGAAINQIKRISKNKDKINRFQNSTENETRCRKASSKPNGTMSKRKETAESDQSTIDGEVAEAQPETSTRYHPEMKTNTRIERQFCLAPRMYFIEFMY